MNWVERFFKLSLKDKLLLLEAAAYLTFWQLIVKVLPYSCYKSSLGKLTKDPVDTSVSSIELIKKIKKAIYSSSKYLPWSPVCFPQALAGKSMLKRRKIKSTFYLGVASNRSEKIIDLHSWLMCGNQTVTGGGVRHQFTVYKIYE